jgi:pyruvate/2-oxoglutarate dehydrogenase complex dihydrolipoamide acyltransferase (E2) component
MGDSPQGRIARWTCRVGDHVRAREVIAEIESDKANFDVEAPADGVIEAIFLPVDATFSGDVVLARP